MAGSLVQSVVMPALHGKGTQFCRPDKTCAVTRVTVTNLQLRSPSLRFSGTHVPLYTFFLGTESILRGHIMRPVRKQIRCVPVEASFENFTEDIIKVIMLAQEESRRLGHNYVGSEQLLLGLLGKKHSLAAMYLGCLDLNLKDARVIVESITGRGSGFVEIAIPFTPHAKQILEQAREEARQLEHNYIGDEHLFLALLADGGGVAGTVLETIGVDPRKMHTELIEGFGMAGESTEVGDAVVWDESNKQRKSTSNLSEKLKNNFWKNSHYSFSGAKSPPARLDEQPNKISSAEGNERRNVAKDERDKTDLHVLLIEVLENCRMVAAQLEAQNKNLQLDRDQIKEQTNNLLGVLNRIADSLGKIADKL